MRDTGFCKEVCRTADTSAVQRLHCNLKSLFFFAEKSSLRNFTIFKNQFGNLCGADTHLVLDFSDGESRCSLFNMEAGESFASQLRMSQGVYCKVIGERAVGIEAFQAV